MAPGGYRAPVRAFLLPGGFGCCCTALPGIVSSGTAKEVDAIVSSFLLAVNSAYHCEFSDGFNFFFLCVMFLFSGPGESIVFP